MARSLCCPGTTSRHAARSRRCTTRWPTSKTQRRKCSPRPACFFASLRVADFRGLATWLQRFAGRDRAAGSLWPRPHDQARIAAARLAVLLLDETQGTDDAVVAVAAERLTGLLARPLAVSPDERILLSKVLIDDPAHRSDTTAVMRIAAQVQDFIRSGSVSPAWQARWWLLMAGNHEYFGAADAAGTPWRAPHTPGAIACIAPASLRASVRGNAQRAQGRAGRAPTPSRARSTKPFTSAPDGRLPACALRRHTSLRMRQPAAALQRLERLLAICDDVEVPMRDRGSYLVQRAYALMALGRFADAVVTLESQRPYQRGAGRDPRGADRLRRWPGDPRQGRPGGAARLCDALSRLCLCSSSTSCFPCRTSPPKLRRPLSRRG